jgi:hypothetical protein
MNKSRQPIAQSSVGVTGEKLKVTLSLAFGTAGERSVPVRVANLVPESGTLLQKTPASLPTSAGSAPVLLGWQIGVRGGSG